MSEFLSVVVPVFNEEEAAPVLIEAVRSALADRENWELVLVDDGSADRTVEIVQSEADRDPRVRLVRLARNYGQSTAMQAGFDHSRGDVVVTMDGDLQNDPRDIPALVAKLNEGSGYDLVAGYRVRRQDRLLTRKVPSWVANRIIAWLTDVPIRDNGCSLKAYRRTLLNRMRLYSDMHRFIPALAAGTAGARIAEIPVRHHPRRLGSSKYGLSRIFKVAADLLTIQMIRSFRLRPLLMLGLSSFFSLAIGVFFGVVSFLPTARGPDGRMSFVFIGVALVWLGLGAFLFMIGLVAEVVVRQSPGATHGPTLLARELR